MGSPEYQADLAEHLKEQLVPDSFWQFLQGNKIKIVIDGDKTLPYQEAERHIASKERDIAFTLSPVISVTVKDNGYTFAARIPSSKTYQSALFVKADSAIKSIDDIKPTTTIALGATNSASSFYMPSYDLYGKRATLYIGHRGSEILKLVKTGKADVGSAALGDTIKATDANIRISSIKVEISLVREFIYLLNSPNQTVKR
ncbi:PhnD/SsuA/transferrin family substrate-binding protein [Chlorogloea sp. CCALA 695]|uniref:PhnD/SsuA/transferrin family substrate-binding protein n=1 Tax=Chlorogloea sp. CCALA 695 TaxID=2107693 RepID=UPI001304AAB9|nr:PhnD/SsuA/transferrin family substrate-binding protein [Chlorogloea sp. CCALA 695]